MGFLLRAPASVPEALAILSTPAEGGRAILAGGTDLLLDLDEGRLAASELVSLRRLPWRNLRWEARSLVVGSTLPLGAIDEQPRVRAELPGFWEAVHAVGGPALRHRATLGGNLGRSSPASDLIPILLALDARVRLLGPKGTRDLPVESFVVGSRKTSLDAGELIQSVFIPRPSPSAYLWQRVRPANDISQVGVAVAFSPSPPHWRVAIGGILPRAQRILPAEAVITQAHPSDFEVELAAHAAAEHAPFATDKRATQSYRRRLVSVLVRRALGLGLKRLASRDAA